MQLSCNPILFCLTSYSQLTEWMNKKTIRLCFKWGKQWLKEWKKKSLSPVDEDDTFKWKRKQVTRPRRRCALAFPTTVNCSSRFIAHLFRIIYVKKMKLLLDVSLFSFAVYLGTVNITLWHTFYQMIALLCVRMQERAEILVEILADRQCGALARKDE